MDATPDAAGPPARPRLSLIVITKNEAHRLAACLASVPFAGEVVVVDSGSTDGTAELARRLGARVIETADWPGFGPQKNRALDAASGDWVLSLDADEAASPELAAQIRRVVEAGDAASSPFAAYTLSRLSSLAGRWVRHGDWYPDPVLRLFRRGAARFSDAAVHEGVVCDAAVGRLDGHLLHVGTPTLDDCLDKVNRYSSARAAQLRRRGRGGLAAAVGHGLWAFVRGYVVRRGFLDGAIGFVVAVSSAESTYYSYLKASLPAEGD